MTRVCNGTWTMYRPVVFRCLFLNYGSFSQWAVPNNPGIGKNGLTYRENLVLFAKLVGANTWKAVAMQVKHAQTTQNKDAADKYRRDYIVECKTVAKESGLL